MKGVDVTSARRRHLPLEVQGEVIGQEVTRGQSGAAVQGALANIQANHKI